MKDRVYARDHRDMPSVLPTGFSQERFMCPLGYLSNPASSITSKFVHTSTNKQRCPVNCVVVCFSSFFLKINIKKKLSKFVVSFA